MVEEALDVAGELRRLVDEKRVSWGALSAMTGVSVDVLRSFSEERSPGLARAGSSLGVDEVGLVSTLVAMLGHVAEERDDDRLAGILAGLSQTFELETSVIAALVGVDEEQIREFLAEPSSVSAASKYELAVRLSYLVNAINLSSPRS